MTAWTIAEWAGRIAFVALFAMSGMNHLMNLRGTAAYAQSKGVPAPAVAVAGTGLLLLAAALMILFQWQAVWGAGLLVLFLVPAAFVMHNFWSETDPMAKANQMAHFLKNLSLAGAALLYAVWTRAA